MNKKTEKLVDDTICKLSLVAGIKSLERALWKRQDLESLKDLEKIQLRYSKELAGKE